MGQDQITAPIIAGAAVRRFVRRYLQRTGVQFTEEKGWLDSQFLVTAPREKLMEIGRALDAAFN